MFISIDVGGTNTRVAGADELDNLEFASEPLRRRNAHDFNDDLAYIAEAALQVADGEAIEAVGIGVPGLPNEDKTELRTGKNLASWIGQPLVSSLSQELGGCPVFLDSDVTGAVLGEAYYGDTKGDFDYVIWGTGIGGGSIVRADGKPSVEVTDWRTHFADWEMDNGGAELAKQFGRAPEDFTAEDWQIVAETFKQHTAEYLAMRSPHAIVFGGGLAVKHAAMIESVADDLDAQISVTKFGDNSGLVGGFGLIRNELDSI